MKNKVFTVLLSVVLAVVLWAYVITVERPESENTFYNIPVILDGEDVLKERGMMITNQSQQVVTLRLSGNRKELNQLKTTDRLAAVIDLSRIKEAGVKSLTYEVDLPQGIELESRQPDIIALTVTEWDKKEIPVSLHLDNRVPEGYYVDKQSATLDPAVVTITGPKQIVNEIAMAKVSVDLAGQKETVVEDLVYTLCDKDGEPIPDVSSITTDSGEIRTTVFIQQLKELKLTYQVLDGGGLKASEVTVTADYDTITVAGSPMALEGYDEIDLGTVDLGTLTESTQLKFPIKLKEGISNQSGISEVTVDVELPDMEIKEYSVENIRLKNTPKGYTAQSLAQALPVKIRGRGPVLERITDDMITAEVDLTDAVPGASTYEVTITIEGFGEADNVGAVDKYTVTVQVKDTEQTPPPEPETTPPA